MLRCLPQHVFANKDQEYNRILNFIGSPKVDHFEEVFTRPSLFDLNRPNLTRPAVQLLYAVFRKDTLCFYEQLGFNVSEWEDWYKSWDRTSSETYPTDGA